MDIQIKLENVFKNLVENTSRFGTNNKFISLTISNLDGREPSDDNAGKIYLGVLKFYSVSSNDFKSVDLFIKIEPKTHRRSDCDIENRQDLIKYDYKFHNEYVAYKHVLPFLNQAFSEQIETVKSPFTGIVSHRFSDDKDNAYTIEEFKNEVRYKEIGMLNKKQYRHSWNSTTYERKKFEENFLTIKPNSTFALDKCVKYFDTKKEEEVINRLTDNEILNIFPEFYVGEMNVNSEESNIIVIENMLPAGFHTSNESIFLDKDRILLTLKTLGKFHASSYIAKHNHPEEFNAIARKFKATGWTLPEYWDIYPEFLNQHLSRGVDCLRKDPKYARHVYKFEDILKNPKERFFSLIKPDEDVAVICHGDFCKNNILYKFDANDYKSSDSQADVTMQAQTSRTKIACEDTKMEINENKKIDFNIKDERERIKECLTFSSNLKSETRDKLSGTSQMKENRVTENKYRKDQSSRYDKMYRSQIEKIQNVYDKTSTWPYNRQRKENKVNEYSHTLDKKRKEFLHHILETNSKEISSTKSLNFIQKKQDGSDTITKENNLESPTIETENRNIHRWMCIENKVSDIHSLESYEPPSLSSDENESNTRTIGNDNETKSKEFETEHEDTKSIIKETESIITDRLEFLEEKYRQLEKIYNVNKSVLERRVVNLKIIEKLNEKKQILEEICRKIEKISEKQQMETKLQNSINKLYQNVDDIEKKQKLRTTLLNINKSNTCDAKKESTNETAEKIGVHENSNENNTNKVTNTEVEKKSSTQITRIKSNNKHHNLTPEESKSIEEKFNDLYGETFSNAADIDSSYEKMFNELTKKIDTNSEENLENISSKVEEPLEIKCTQGSGEESSSTEDEEQTLTVKQRREILERSISLSNEPNSLNKKQWPVRDRNSMRRSISDANQVQFKKVLVSWRNITLNNESIDSDSDTKTAMINSLRGLQTERRPRIFTDSSLSINECDEMNNDDVFLTTKDNLMETDSSVSNKIKKEPNENSVKVITKSKTNPEINRPAPLKRTISLMEKITHDPKEQMEQNKVTSKNHDESTFNHDSIDCKANINSDKKKKFFIGDDDTQGSLNVDRYSQTSSLPSSAHERKTNLSQHKTMDNNSDRHLQSFKVDIKNREVREQSCQTDMENLSNVKGLEAFRFGGISDHRRELVESTRTQYGYSQTLRERSKSTQDRARRSRVLKDRYENLPKIVFFDLARMIYASPVIDLSFFLFLNVSHDLRVKCWDEFISTYHSSLRSCIPSNVPAPSYADLLRELKDKCVYGYFLCCFFLPWMMEENPHQQVDQWINNGGERGTEAIANILRFLIDRHLI